MDCDRQQNCTGQDFKSDAYNVDIEAGADGRIQIRRDGQAEGDPDQRLNMLAVLAP